VATQRQAERAGVNDPSGPRVAHLLQRKGDVHIAWPRASLSVNGTFSISSQRGPALRQTRRKTSSTSPDRLPPMPAARPAWERFRQGKPAVTSSVAAGKLRSFVMSAWCSTPGNRDFSTALAPGSISHSSVDHWSSSPNPSPPIPATGQRQHDRSSAAVSVDVHDRSLGARFEPRSGDAPREPARSYPAGWLSVPWRRNITVPTG